MYKTCFSTIALCMLVASIFLSGCATFSKEDVGKGMQVGSVADNAGALSPIIWVTGAILEESGKRNNMRPIATEKDEQALWDMLARDSLSQRFTELLKASNIIDRAELRNFAQEFCTCVDTKTSKGTLVVQFRKDKLLQIGIKHTTLPDGPNDTLIPYYFEKNPYLKCVETMMVDN